MKIFTYALMLVALGLIVFNSSKINMEAPFQGESTIAAIGILAAACVIVLMIILQISWKIKKKQ